MRVSRVFLLKMPLFVETVSEDIVDLIEYYRMSKPLETTKISDDTGVLNLNIGTVSILIFFYSL